MLFPHYLDDFERLYQQITSEHDFVQDKGLNALKYYQTAVFLLQEDEYYQKCLNFFSNIDLSTYFDSSEVDLYAMETRTFFDEKEIGADERLRIHELIVRRLLSEVDEEKFNLIKFCHHHLNPELPKQPLEFSLNDSQHLAKVDVLFDEVTADEITPIAWNQETLTFCYQYMLQHMAGLKNIAQWDNLQLDDLMQSINLLETEQHKINVMAVLSGFHAYLLKTERAVTNEKLTNAFDALNNLCQQPYPDLETLIGINNSCPDLLGFVTKTDCLQFANDNQVCLFMASIRNVVETAKLEQSVHVKVKALLENFDVYISNSENVFRFSEINQAKEYIRQQMISRGNPIHFDKALKSWLKQLDEETELNFQLAHLRAELVFEQRIEQLDSMQQERFKKGVKLLVAGTNPLSEVSGRVVEQAYKELYEAINAPAEYEEFRQQQNETPFIVRLAQSYSSKSSLPVQEKYAIQALNKIAESIFQINDQALATNNPYQLRGTAGVKRTYTYQQAQGGSKTLRITSTMDRMMGIIDEVCRGKITARNAHAQIMTIGEKACRKHHILDDAEFDPNNGVDKKKAIYLMAKKGEFIDNKALLATEKLCKDYCLQVKAEIEAGPWAIAFGIGTRVGGQRISPTMVKMRDIIKGADRGKTSWESAYHFIHRQANLAMDRRSSPRFDINLFSCGKKDPALLYKKIQKVNLLCGSDDAIEKLLESVGKEIQGVLEQADWGNGFKKTLRSLFGGKTIVFNGHEYKHRPEHLAKAVAYYHAYQMKSIDGRVALDGIRAVFQQASASKTWLRSQGMHSFYQQQAKELGAALAPPIVPNQF